MLDKDLQNILPQKQPSSDLHARILADMPVSYDTTKEDHNLLRCLFLASATFLGNLLIPAYALAQNAIDIDLQSITDLLILGLSG